MHNLPKPPPGKTGWPWTMESKPFTPTASNGQPWPKITIVTPSYSQGAYLEETIRSVLLQNYPNLEYIIIDGGSTDNSVDVIRAYEPWITRWVSEKDNGQADAINKGFRASTGQIMGWLNSDDCLEINALRYVAEAFVLNPSTQTVCGFRKLTGTRKRKLTGVYLPPDPYTLSRFCYVAQETVFWHRSVWDTIGELDASFSFAMDYEYWQRMMAANIPFMLLPVYLGIFRVHGQSKGAVLNDARTNELQRIYRAYLRTDKTERELKEEIGKTWWKRMKLLRQIAHKGFLQNRRFAEMVVKTLSVRADRIRA